MAEDPRRRHPESRPRGKSRYFSRTAGNRPPQFGLDERGREGGKRGRRQVSPFPLLEAGDGLIRGVPRQIETVQNRGDFKRRGEENLADFWIGKRGNALAVEIRSRHVPHYVKPPEHNHVFCTCRRGTVLRPRGVTPRTVETGKPDLPPTRHHVIIPAVLYLHQLDEPNNREETPPIARRDVRRKVCRRALQHHDRFRDGVRRVDLGETWKRGNYQGGE